MVLVDHPFKGQGIFSKRIFQTDERVEILFAFVLPWEARTSNRGDQTRFIHLASFTTAEYVKVSNDFYCLRFYVVAPDRTEHEEKLEELVNITT